MAFVNLGQIIYPIGSIYISVINTSPATIFGGTWTTINGDACLMACGNYVDSYGGNKKINTEQLPSHVHDLNSASTSKPGEESTPAGKAWYQGLGNNTFDVKDGDFLYSSNAKSQWRTYPAGTCPTGGGQDYLPYHFRTYMWKRTA